MLLRDVYLGGKTVQEIRGGIITVVRIMVVGRRKRLQVEKVTERIQGSGSVLLLNLGAGYSVIY